LKDRALEAYVSAIERHFQQRRGSPHVLSPHDFALARGWYDAGIPVGSVLRGIDNAFEADATAASLSFCRSHVSKVSPPALQLETPEQAALPVSSDASLADTDALVVTLLRALERLGSVPAFETALRQIREVHDLLSVATRPNWAYIKDKLRHVDDAVSKAAIQGLPDEERAALEAEAERAVERQRGRIDGMALQEARRRYLVRRARERLGLPVVGID